ncbi:MAG: response regulator transcription factor [Bacteroidales bacterium]|nr:response regulator transcription factor [Bacteroidales bacterium]
MNKIFVGIFDEHKITLEGLRSLLKDVDDINVVLSSSDKINFLEKLRTASIHIIIIGIHSSDEIQLRLIEQLKVRYPKVKILILSTQKHEEIVFKTIKAGAKGFLSQDTGKNDLVEAIYTLRNGHDYFSNSITSLLLNQYIHKIKTDEKRNVTDINMLSLREVEILKLWGDGLTNKEIAEKLFISIRTVESHKNHIMQKLNMKTTVDVIKFAIKNNLIEI